MKPINFFIIDDDKLFVFLTKKTISTTHIEARISEFNDGQEALDHLVAIAGDNDRLPDIILLDLSMPIMDGWEFLEEYSRIAPSIAKKIKLYIFSSSISPHDIERANNINVVTDFITKPLFKEKFIEMIEN